MAYRHVCMSDASLFLAKVVIVAVPLLHTKIRFFLPETPYTLLVCVHLLYARTLFYSSSLVYIFIFI